ncbi:protein of unknown function [Rhodovastum atsumiense]|nr:protein of unknown function [Rhodovastum atsumiense]
MRCRCRCGIDSSHVHGRIRAVAGADAADDRLAAGARRHPAAAALSQPPAGGDAAAVFRRCRGDPGALAAASLNRSPGGPGDERPPEPTANTSIFRPNLETDANKSQFTTIASNDSRATRE